MQYHVFISDKNYTLQKMVQETWSNLFSVTVSSYSLMSSCLKTLKRETFLLLPQVFLERTVMNLNIWSVI